ncbi:MAG TPA: sensor histidine kinase [Cerasibacillus sp.]|uniref:sensor histidine kinase n=1 Tax=Cerasibacillus sp. TaxID=2498711 RepID=UPI002F3F86CE
MLRRIRENLPELLNKMYENSREVILFFDRDGKVISMNKHAENILKKEVLEQMASGNPKSICMTCRGYMSEHDLRTCQSCYMYTGEKEGSFQVYLDTKGAGVVPYTATFQTIDEETGTRVLMLRDMSKQFETQELLMQKILMRRVVKAQEDERKRISRELHDSVAQEMLSLLVDLRLLKYMNVSEEAKEKVQQTEGSLMRLLDDIQHMSVELRPAALDDLGLEAAFRTHFKTIEKNYGLYVQFESNIGNKRYEGEIETVVYRICQEAIFNALKYAEVDDVSVHLSEENETLHLRIKDKGVGFNLNNINPKGTGLGLYGMRERAELVSGQLSIHSSLGNGTVVYLIVPLQEVGNDDN